MADSEGRVAKMVVRFAAEVALEVVVIIVTGAAP